MKNNIVIILICCLSIIAQTVICCIAIKEVKIAYDPWNTYCTLYKVDPNNPTEEEENFYLDYWLGSAESEQYIIY